MERTSGLKLMPYEMNVYLSQRIGITVQKVLKNASTRDTKHLAVVIVT